MRSSSILALVTISASACGGGEFTATQFRVLDASPPGLDASGVNDGADPPDAPREAMGDPETGADAPDAILATDGSDAGRDAQEADSGVFDAKDEDTDGSGEAEAASASDSGSGDSYVADSGSTVDGYLADTGDEPDASDSGTVADAWDGSCALAHSDGVGNVYYDCSPLGTYNSTTAMEACVAYAEAMGLGQVDCSDGWMCPGSSETFVCFSADGVSPSGYCWEYDINPGHVLIAGCPVDFTGHFWN